MYARVIRAQTAPEDLDTAVDRVRKQYVPAVRDEGAKAYLILADRTSGKAMTIALYETEKALRASQAGVQARAANARTPLTSPREEEFYEVVEDARF